MTLLKGMQVIVTEDNSGIDYVTTAQELLAKGIRIDSVKPGPSRTGMAKGVCLACSMKLYAKS